MLANRKAVHLAVDESRSKVIDAFLRDCADRGLTRETGFHYKYVVRKYAAFLESRGLAFEDADREALRSYLRYLREVEGLVPKSLENHFACLSSFYEFLLFEGKVNTNLVPSIRKRYLRAYKSGAPSSSPRKVLSVKEMANFVGSILDTRDRAIAILLAKTGIRRGELVAIDMVDVDWERKSILLKPRKKRTNRLVFFDEEAAVELARWMRLRDRIEGSESSQALFLGETGERLGRNGVYGAIRAWAERAGISDPSSSNESDRFFVHCFRHWFTTVLLRAGMPREYVAFLRGDAPAGPIDIYNRIDPEAVRVAYLAAMPRLFD